MKIGVDIRCLMEKQYSGISQYTLNLLRALFEIDRENEYILFYNSAKQVQVPEFNYPNVKIKSFQYSNKIFNFGLKFFNRPKIDELIGGCDLIFLPTFHILAISDKVKLVSVLHDLSFERHPEFFSLKAWFWHKLVNAKNLCERSKKIIAISEHTKKDIVEIYKILPEKIKVIHLGVADKFKPIEDREILRKIKEKYSLPEEFILYLGNLEPRKNIETLIEAVGKNSKLPKLVIAGGKGWKYRKIYKFINKYPDRVKVIGYVDDSDKPMLYNLAKIFVYPSFYEGFGLPPLEAMACGVPVITSHVSSLPEVVGSAGITVDPYDVNDLRQSLEAINQSKELQILLKKEGINQSKKFSWRKCAEEVLATFKSVI